jgi:hypothetical protein
VANNYEQTRTNIHALSGIRTHGLSVEEIKAYASAHAATVAGKHVQEAWKGSATQLILTLLK